MGRFVLGLIIGLVVGVLAMTYNPNLPQEVRSGLTELAALVMRGTLAEVLAGTSIDPVELLKGPWPDVIAFRKVREDGTPGEPIAIFARGLGPLFIAGYPIAGANINSEAFGTIWGTIRRG